MILPLTTVVRPMSTRFIRLLKFSVATIVASLLLYLIAGSILGPGIRDYKKEILNDYEFSDAGGYEKMIIYSGKERRRGIVIDAQVDAYRVEGANILVAVTPRLIIEGDDKVLRTRLADKCEYWQIDTVAHVVRPIEIGRADLRDLRCKN